MRDSLFPRKVFEERRNRNISTANKWKGRDFPNGIRRFSINKLCANGVFLSMCGIIEAGMPRWRIDERQGYDEIFKKLFRVSALAIMVFRDIFISVCGVACDLPGSTPR